MREWSKYAIEVDGVKKYFSAANWRDTSRGTSVADRFKIYEDFIIANSSPGETLSIGSGYAHLELDMFRRGHSIVCSDIDDSIINHVRTEEPKMQYVRYIPTEMPFDKKFDTIISFSVFYLFNKKDLSKVFKNVRGSLKDGGILIIDPGGGPDGVITSAIDMLQKIEMLIYSTFNILRGRKVKLAKKMNGYRSKDREIIEAAKSAGLNLKKIQHFDYYTELGKRTWTGRLLMSLGVIRAVTKPIGRRVPYVRLMAFGE